MLGDGMETDVILVSIIPALLLIAAIWLLVRHRILVGRRGVFLCGLRTMGGPTPGSWMLGMARYVKGRFEWYRFLDPRFTPTIVLERGPLHLVEHHVGAPEDRLPFLVDDEVVTVETGRRRRASTVQLVVEPVVVTGFMSWLEATPPGGVGYAARERL